MTDSLFEKPEFLSYLEAGASTGKSRAGVKEAAAIFVELRDAELCNSLELLF